MNHTPASSPVETHSELESWKDSRSGAWAGRGFDYQHWVTVLVLLRQWAGQAPLGYLVPEGLDDCVIELSDHQIWLQAKSRKTGEFPNSEVRSILDDAAARAAELQIVPAIRSTVILEQAPINLPEVDVAHLFDDKAGRVFVCRAPADEVLHLLSTQLQISSVIAQGLASDLYGLVVSASAENASLPFDRRRRISVTEVDRRIFERLEAEDPTAIDYALLSGVLEPIDFITPVNEPDFYTGVKVKAGHIAANLVLDRPKDIDRLLGTLWQRRHVLVSGPSGAGKSALTWLAAAAIVDRMRWYQITGIATAGHAEAIVRFIRARRPAAKSPLGLVFDDVGSANSDLWNILARELRGFPNSYLLGSLRQEDVSLIANQADTGFVSIQLDDELAQAVWEKLSAVNQTKWTHWREPFEQSQGLMLEYIHLLTQGRRLATVIEDQVRQRERERRDDELGIIRSTAVICARGGEVDANRLFELLDLEADAGLRALRRLIDEHLVHESRPGILGGLHKLRSDALVKASHDEAVFLAFDSLWKYLPTATTDTLPQVVQSLFADPNVRTDLVALPKLASVLDESCNVDLWTAILTGLGLATLDLHVIELTSILDQYGLERAHWFLAASFADPLLEIPELSVSDQWTRLRDALTEFRSLLKQDLRAECLAHLSAGTAPPDVTNISQANALLSTLVPICGGDPVEIAIGYDFLADEGVDVRQIGRMLSTAYLVDRNLARHLVEKLGGEQALFDLFRHQIPWTTPPKIDPTGPYGRTVRSNWYQVSEKDQPEPHATICEICEILIGISPDSDAAASDAVNPSGQVITISEHRPWSKNIPRANLPAKTRVAWNVAFRQILLTKSAACSLTDYTHQMANHVRRTEKVFRSFSEKWIKRKQISNADAIASEINGIVKAVNTLAYAAPEVTPSMMTKPHSAGSNDSLGALLTGVLDNLVGRMSKIDTAKSAAAFAGDLHGQARKHHRSAIWRTMSSPPLAHLDKLAERLSDVSSILHEMAEDGKPEAIARIVKTAKKADMGNAVRAAARHCHKRAARRFAAQMHELEQTLASRGWKARCLYQSIDEFDCPYWPAREIAILVEVDDLADQWLPILEELLLVTSQHVDANWPFSAVPVMNGQILASLAMINTSHIPLPDQEFARKWADSLSQPMFSSALLDSFEEAVGACLQMSAIINSRRVQDLHPDEENVLSHTRDIFMHRRAEIEIAAIQTETEHFALALDYLDRNWMRVSDEAKAVKSGQAVEAPLCMTPHLAIAGHGGEDIVDSAAVRLALLQAECDRLNAV